MSSSSFGKIKTVSQFEKMWEILKEQVLSRPLFFDNSEQAKEERKRKAEKSLYTFGTTYFPEYMRYESAPFHKGWDKIRRIENEPLMVKAFRGGGKSTYFTFLDIVHRLCYAKSRYIIIGSYTVDKAGVFTGRILLELLYNPRLRNDFGDFFKHARKKSITYFHVDIPEKRGEMAAVQAVSIGQDPRGFIHGAYRPDCVRLDDIQSRKRAKSRKFVQESIEWITHDLIPALSEPYSLIISATPLNTQCVSCTLEKGTEQRRGVKTYTFPAVKRRRAMWPEVFPKKRLARIRKVIGTLTYNQEYLLIPVPLDEKKFKEEWIKYYDWTEIAGRRFDTVVSWTDPSAKKEEQHNLKAIVMLGFIDGICYVLKAWIKKASINQMVNAMYSLYEIYSPHVMYYEDVGSQSILEEVFRLEMEKRGQGLPIRPEGNTLNKETRIETTLSVPVENGIIRFRRDDPDQAVLVDQLIQFPDGEYDDGPDGLEGAYRKGKVLSRRRGGLPTSRMRREAHTVLRGY